MTRCVRLLGVAVVAGSILVAASCGFAGTGSADAITDHGALLRGQVGNTVTGATSWHVEYGVTDAYGSSTPTSTLTVSNTAVASWVSKRVEGLAANTEYHYRFCAVDVDGDGTCGEDATFTTTANDQDYVIGDGEVLRISLIQPISVGGRVDASSSSNGTSPAGRVDSWPPLAAPTAPFQDSGPVSCLRAVGNRATIGFVAEPFIAGAPTVPMLAFVEDNAATSTPDRWAVKALAAPATTCPVPNLADFPARDLGGLPVPTTLISGDFVVHDHPAPG